jgi:hypothetical protein
VVNWLAGKRNWIKVLYPSSYSQELKPDELLNADLKQAVTKRAAARLKGELKKVIGHLHKIAPPFYELVRGAICRNQNADFECTDRFKTGIG